jgi:cyclopropane fatty-acyl-phospholipid synthase-like methyltransferase
MKTVKVFLEAIGLWKPLRRMYLSSKAWLYSLSVRGKEEDLYTEEYFLQYNYSSDNPKERLIKETQSEYIMRAINPKKVVVAGCAAGELVRELRQKSVEAWGFDISRNLKEIAYPEVVNYLRRGSLCDIPFQPEDGFNALIAFDVFEHIPKRKIDTMVKEIKRLSPEYLVTIIAHDYVEVGHVTLKPLKWWQKKFKEYYRLKDIEVDLNGLPKVHGIDGLDNAIRIWQRV